jgi:hypothetical protein
LISEMGALAHQSERCNLMLNAKKNKTRFAAHQFSEKMMVIPNPLILLHFRNSASRIPYNVREREVEVGPPQRVIASILSSAPAEPFSVPAAPSERRRAQRLSRPARLQGRRRLGLDGREHDGMLRRLGARLLIATSPSITSHKVHSNCVLLLIDDLNQLVRAVGLKKAA